MRKIIILKQEGKLDICFGSVEAMLISPFSPMKMSYSHFQRLKKEAGGYPFSIYNCQISQFEIIDVKEAKKQASEVII